MGREAFTLRRLCELAGPGVTARTVRYCVQRHLLPRPARPGRGATYGPGHLGRLRPVRLLRREHLPLDEIRARLASLSDAQVEELLREQPREGPRLPPRRSPTLPSSTARAGSASS